MRYLLVEDDKALAARTAAALTDLGHDILHVPTIHGALILAQHERPDAIILDRMLPDGDSTSIIGEWRSAGLDMPIVMLTVQAALHERIDGLDAGADDYLAKPCDPVELDARLRALVRLRDRSGAPAKDVLVTGDIELDYRRREVRRDGRLIALQPREFKLLELLMSHVGEIVPRSQLLSDVWNLRFDPRTKLIETHISRLRDKLNAGFEGDVIETIRRIGYRLRKYG
jgi:two-component system OmpR family response regulator